ncbi:hypothetical protein BG262_06450 [Floricoccus penangensis]|uniref:Glycosyltransferase 2-like domain-containing protein n=1 Tax=Floricoccus penangensis TaxID=1859475 RepID=A0A9Q5JER3_9LACT|nr:glycosyltransferase family 2 protein [Floricoccus penangensis]OFI45911.1 hypothetical protein BG262_06450 [Floricoccus penangensis]
MFSDEVIISIIIPVYNSEKYISRCLKSISEQKYKNFEVIVVDDGSTDSSAEIIKKYTETDDRIKYLYQDNQGVSVARNNGLGNITGKYVTFLDSDDYYESDRLQNFIDFGVGYDLTFTGYKLTTDQGKLIKEFNRESSSINKSEVNDLLVNDKIVYGYCWNKYYLADIIKYNSLLFKKELDFAEDLIFNLEFAQKSNNYKYLKDSSYIYVRSENSITKGETVDLYRKRLTHLIAIEKALEFDINTESRQKLYREYFILGSRIYKNFFLDENVPKKETTNVKRKLVQYYRYSSSTTQYKILSNRDYLKYSINLHFPIIAYYLKLIPNKLKNLMGRGGR